MIARRSIAVALAALLASAAPVITPARAQTAAVVSSCGTLPVTLSAGQKAPLTVDTTGKLCQSSGAGGSAATLADGADVTQGALGDSACGSDNGTCSMQALIKRLNQNLTTLNTSIGAGPTSQYPSGATPITISATGTTGATAATLAANATKKTYVCGFNITSDATAALAGTATIAGVVTGTMSFIQNVGSATAAGTLSQTFSPCIPSSATNTPIVVTSVAAGVGGNTAVNAWGFQL